MLLLVKNKKTVINSFEDFKNDDQLTNLLKEKEKKERELEKYKVEKRKKKLEKNEGKEEEDDNPASDTNYMSADEETEDKESAKKVRAFEYHIALINLIARCCGGENSTTEGMAQDLITMEKCVSVIGNPNFNGYLKAAYLRFLGEVWLNTFRKVIASFQCFFDLLKITSKDIKSINKETEVVAKDQIEYYVEFTKVLCIFFAPEQKNTVSSENMSIVKELFDTLIESLSSKVLQPIWNDILTAIEILKGSVKDLRDIQEVVDSTKKKKKKQNGRANG